MYCVADGASVHFQRFFHMRGVLALLFLFYSYNSVKMNPFNIFSVGLCIILEKFDRNGYKFVYIAGKM